MAQIRRPQRKQVASGQQQNDTSIQNNFIQQKIQNIVDKISNIEKSIKAKLSPSDNANAEVFKELKLLKEQYATEISKLQLENDNFKKDAEYRRVAEEQVQKEKHQENIKNKINIMIEKGAIASGDADSINHWTSLYNADFDSTDKIVNSQLEKLNTTQMSATNNTMPPQQSIIDVGNKMASEYLTGNNEVFNPKIK